jgi:hypothetical protein
MAIMQWKKEAAGYRAHWQGIQFLLTEHPTTHKWRLFANNRHVKEEYRSLHAAISDIEARQEKLVMQAVKERMTGGDSPHGRLLNETQERLAKSVGGWRGALAPGAGKGGEHGAGA